MEDRKNYNLYLILSMCFAVLLVLSNTIANRLFVVGGILLPSAVIVFPATYIIGDVVTELFGFKYTRQMIVISLVLNCVFVLFGIISTILPAPRAAENILAYNIVFNFTPRTAIASIIAFLIGSIANAFTMEKMKQKEKIQKHLILRIMTSTILGEFADTCIFISIVFWGLLDIQSLLIMMISQFSFKVLYELIFSPITVIAIKRIKSKYNI